MNWDTIPSDMSEIWAAVEKAHAKGPPAIAELALLCSLYNHRKNSPTIAHEDEGEFLFYKRRLWHHLADSEELPWAPKPLLPRQPDTDYDSEWSLELFEEFLRSTTRRLDLTRTRVRKQHQWLEQFLEDGNYPLAWQVLAHIQHTLVYWKYDDWDDYFKFDFRLTDVVRTLQPYANAYPDEIYEFVSGVLLKGARAFGPDQAAFGMDWLELGVTCFKWFIRHWADTEELRRIVDLLDAWQERWPVFLIKIENPYPDKGVRRIQMRRESHDLEWGENWLPGYDDSSFGLFRKVIKTIVDKLTELLLPLGPRSAPWQEVFIRPLPDGRGRYEFRADLYDKSDEETTIRETAHTVIDGVYRWVLGKSPIMHLPDPGPGDVQTPIAMPAITITADEVRHGDTVHLVTRNW